MHKTLAVALYIKRSKMITKITLITLLSFNIIVSQEAQNEKNSLKKGTYKSFNDFTSNTPNHQLDFNFENRTNKQILLWGGTEFEIKFKDEKIKKKFINDSVWAVSDGESTFINNKIVSVNKGFNKLAKFDFPISYFVSYIVMRDEENVPSSSVKFLRGIGGAIGGAIAGAPYRRVVAIDRRNGKIIKMNEEGLSMLLGNENIELVDKFLNAKKTKATEEAIFEVLDAYNLKIKNNR